MAKRDLGPAGLVATQAVLSQLVEADERLIVACSGGPDSLALAVASVAAARRTGRASLAVVVDHGMQPGSDVVARRAADQLVELGIGSVRVEAVDVGSVGGPEAAARRVRYEVLRRAADRERAVVLLGHTLDDQAETVLLGLARGSGGRSLAGMASRSGIFLRPFLGVRRHVLRSVCDELGLTPWPDPHNADPAYARARVRHRVLPVLEAELGPGIVEALARSAQLLRDDADLLDGLASEVDPGRDLDCDTVSALPPALRRRVLRSWLRTAGAGELGFDHVIAVERLLSDWHGQRWIGVPGLRVRRVARQLVAERIQDGSG